MAERNYPLREALGSREEPRDPGKQPVPKDVYPTSVESLRPTESQEREKNVEFEGSITQTEIPVASFPIPERGIQRWLWKLSERVVLAHVKRERYLANCFEKLTKVDVSNLRFSEVARLFTLLIERSVRSLAQRIYLPLLKYLLKGYSESFAALVRRELH